MGLKEVLSKLRLVEVTESDSSGREAVPAAAVGRPSAGPEADSPELEELLRSLPPPKPINEAVLTRRPRGASASAAPAGEGRPPAAVEEDGELGAPQENDVELPAFSEVYAAAGIGDPPHGFTAFKVLEMLESSGLAELPPQAKASALAGFLRMNPGGPVAIGEIIQDAVRRDQALDHFEQFLKAKLAEKQAAAERANALLQAEIDALTERHRATMADNMRAISELGARLSEWSSGKRAEERRLQLAVAPFVDGNPISTDSADGESRGS